MARDAASPDGTPAGVRRDGGDEEPLFSQRCERTIDALPRLRTIRCGSSRAPGIRYSTLGWILVSAAVEAAANEPFFTLMRTKIFKPLGMIDTTIDSATDPIPDRVTFYYPRFGGDTRYGPELAREGNYSCFAGAGAFLSTPSDLVRFGLAINGGKLLQPATVKMLQTPQRLTSGEETGYGLGWDLEPASLAGETDDDGGPRRRVLHGWLDVAHDVSGTRHRRGGDDQHVVRGSVARPKSRRPSRNRGKSPARK